MRSPDTPVAVLSADLSEGRSGATATGAQLVTIASLKADGTPEVRVDLLGPVVAARLACRTTRERLQTAIELGQPAVVVFERGDPSRPIIVGVIEPLEPQSPVSGADIAPGTRAAHTPAGDATTASQVDATIIEADVDGRRVRVTAKDEIVLQCGAASVTLRRNGRVVIRGTYVETHSDGTNRIKGGQVQIN